MVDRLYVALSLSIVPAYASPHEQGRGTLMRLAEHASRGLPR
jgi:hypothetical protein